MPKPILIVVCGTPPDFVRSVFGDFAKWFHDALCLAAGNSQLQTQVWDPRRMPSPSTQDFSGIAITGAPESLTKPEGWMEAVVEFIREAAETQTPLLGICFGHQLLGCAFGAPTIKAPEHGEHGGLAVGITALGEADPLLSGLPKDFEVHSTHFDQVDPDAISYGNGLQILASSPNTKVQALAAGPFLRSVQFHPEFTEEIMERYLQSQRAEDSIPKDAIQPVSQSPYSLKIFSNWLDHWVFSDEPSKNDGSLNNG